MQGQELTYMQSFVLLKILFRIEKFQKSKLKCDSKNLLTFLSNLFVTANNFSSKYGINWDSTLLAKSLSPPQASARLKETS